MNHLLIYSAQSSPRLKYILDFILGDLLALTYQLTHDKESFAASSEPKFSYAHQPVGDEIFFECANLLFETNVTPQPISFAEHGRATGFYQVSEKSAMGFDFLASSFLMISLYNEYLPGKKDKYERYRGSQSLNYKLGFLDKPMINFYAVELKKILQARYPQLVFKNNKFSYTATVDIDMAYSYLEKGVGINVGGFLRALLISDFADVKNRYGVLMRGKRDPFDTYDYILNTCKEYGAKSIFFFLLGDRSSLDKNISYSNEKFQKLIKRLAKETEIGIHLSFRSHIANKVMLQEISRLKEISGVNVTRNRFHYLRFLMPASYMRLIKIGLKEDYSMGYAARIGFRAATCSPYKFFNLLQNEATDFTIYPFAFMDTTLTHYNKFDADESLKRILGLMKYVKEVEGEFIGLWHNSSFTEQKEWKGWRNVFETVAREANLLMKESE